MIRRRSHSSRFRSSLIAAVAVTGLMIGLSGVAVAVPQQPTPPPGSSEADGGDGPPARLPVKPPTVAPPAALPTAPGRVPLDTALRAVPTAPRSTTAQRTPSTAAPQAAAPQAAVAATPNRVGVRALVVAIDANDFGLRTWTSMLDRTGAAYDVLYAKDTPLTAESLLRADGAGRYNAVLLTDAMLVFQDAGGGYVSAFDSTEWNILWAYERDFGVRQATLFASYGTFPEDYCLRAGTEGVVGDTPLNATLTTQGRTIFNDLKTTVQIPITQSYVYRNSLASGCGGQAILTAGTAVLGVQSTSTDGRQRIALTFSSNQYLLQANLLAYGLFRWASRGLYFGEQRHFLNVDVDDWFNSTDQLSSTGVLNSNPGFSMTAHDAYNARTQQNALRSRYPLANAFRFGMAFNAGDANMSAGTACSANGGIAQLTATSRCIRNDVRWINHTLSHPTMNSTDYATSLAEINDNLTRAATLGLTTPRTVLKTGEYSGLGVYNPDDNNDVDPPTDFGLAGANVNLLRAAKDAGVKYLHGNMSFASHQAPCFNCGTRFPQAEAAGLLLVPDWPTNIAYFSTTPDEETYFYNSFYGPNGRFPSFPVNQTYSQILDSEAAQALSHIATGSLYTHTLHIGNLRDYSGGKTLATDWLDRILARYTALYSVPLLSPDWPALGSYAEYRNGHFAALGAGADAVYDRTANTVTILSPAAGGVMFSGARTAGFTTYGTEVSARITLVAGAPVTFTPTLRS